MSKEITGALFKQMILHGAAAITAQKQAINDLNVFPVPDGDTGTNMSMTIATAAEALRKAAPASVGQASSVTASALLQGARGNSGVILSLLFRGLSKALKGMETADAAAFAAAMQEGVAAAYKAVMKPAEGTVLTVSRLAAKRAVDTAAEGADVETTLAAAIEEGYDALAQTTDMNPYFGCSFEKDTSCYCVWKLSFRLFPKEHGCSILGYSVIRKQFQILKYLFVGSRWT